MITESTVPWSNKEISLHDIVEDLIRGTSKQAACNKNIISNEISNDIQVLVDKRKLKGLLKRILELIINLTKKTHTYISAKIYSNLVLVHFKEDNLENVSPVINELNQIKPDAENLGGYIGITSENYKFTTISLTFLNR